MKNKTLLIILGGYGETGKLISQLLLKELDFDLIER